MHIVCCVKQVPDTAQVKIDPETNTLIRSGVESICNPYDLVAVEAAVRLKEKYGGKGLREDGRSEAKRRLGPPCGRAASDHADQDEPEMGCPDRGLPVPMMRKIIPTTG